MPIKSVDQFLSDKKKEREGTSGEDENNAHDTLVEDMLDDPSAVAEAEGLDDVDVDPDEEEIDEGDAPSLEEPDAEDEDEGPDLTVEDEPDDAASHSALTEYEKKIRDLENKYTELALSREEESLTKYENNLVYYANRHDKEIPKEIEELKKRVGVFDAGLRKAIMERKEQDAAKMQAARDNANNRIQQLEAERNNIYGHLTQQVPVFEERVKQFKTKKEEFEKNKNAAPYTAPKVNTAREEWKSKNKWFEQNPDHKLSKAVVGISRELARKYPIDSKQHFDEINKELRKRFPNNFSKNKKNTNGNSPVASASKSTPSKSSARKKNKITLSRETLLAARQAGYDVNSPTVRKELARQQALIERAAREA